MEKCISRNLFYKIVFGLGLFFCVQSIQAQGNWRPVGGNTDKYFMGVDSTAIHDGEKVMTIKSIDDGEMRRFGGVMKMISAEKYLGKRVKMTGYMKTTDANDGAAFWFRVDQAGSQTSLSFDNMEDRPIIGSTDWKKYEIVLNVPTEASNIAFGAALTGNGQIWFDNVVFEIVDSSVPITGR